MTKKRKFTAYLATVAVASVLVALDGISGEEYAGLVKVAISAFVLGNGAEHFFQAKKEG